MEDQMKPQEILHKAAEDIATYGHHQGHYYQSYPTWRTSAACAYGALARAYDDSVCVGTLREEPVRQAGALLSRAIRDHLDQHPEDPRQYVKGFPEPQVVIVNYNDDPHTTAEDIILRMKEAANG